MSKAVICAFPGIGKTTLISNDNHYVDLESSDYKWLDSNGEQGLAKEQSKGKLKQVNPDFPANYIEAIVNIIEL